MQAIEGMEALGGSAGFKKHISEMQSTTGVQASNVKADRDFDQNCWGSLNIYFAFIVAAVEASCDDVGGAGTLWGLGLNAQKVWGWLHHDPAPSMDGVQTTMKVEAGAFGTAQSAAWFTQKSNNELKAIFVGGGTGMGIGLALGITASVYWRKK